MQLATTLQVREIMRRHIPASWGCWTNRTSSNKESRIRTVKCYRPSDAAKDAALIQELRQVAGAENVRVDNSYETIYSDSIRVRCTLA